MNEAELFARQSAMIGALLIASGLAALVARRRLASVVLGAFLVVLGATVVLCRPGAREAGWSAMMLLATSAVLAPALFAVFSQWTDVRGSSNPACLLEVDAENAE